MSKLTKITRFGDSVTSYLVSRKGIWPVEIIYVITNPEDSVPDLWRTQLDVEWAGKTRKTGSSLVSVQ